ncbi:MAG TPA: CsbD family protein [Jiangellales bacterium]|nr:CsbD family protein [Jiangellales bacterium]
MGIDDDKIDNKSEEVAGKVKESAGRAMGDERLEAQGRGEQTTANLKQTGRRSGTPS